MKEWIVSEREFSDHPALDFERIFRQCRQNGIEKITFPKNTYLIEEDFCTQRNLAISNHGHNGPKRIAVLLEDVENLDIDFGGSLLLCRGFVTPFALLRSKNIRISGVRLDNEFTQIMEARVVAHHEDGSVEVQPTRGADGFKITHQALYCSKTVFPGDLQGVANVEYRGDTGEIEYGTADNTFGIRFSEMDVEKLENGNLRFYHPKRLPPIGNVLVINGARRVGAGFFCEDCDGVTLSDDIVYGCYGMAFLAQTSQNITLDCFQTKRAEGRFLTSNADATHFVNCSGEILVQNCFFEGQSDDALNIHGMYTRVIAHKGNELLVRQMHVEATGIRIFHAGDRIRALPADTLIPYVERTIASVEVINDRLCRLILTESAEDIAVGDDIENISAVPNLVFRNNTVQNNRARGMLIANIGSSLIENCYFHSSGTAVKLECDGEYWFESGGVGELTVRNCVFDRCVHGNWGKAVIEAQKRKKTVDGAYFHHRIVIENNEFRMHQAEIVQMNNAEELIFVENRITPAPDARPYLVTEHIRSCNVQPDVPVNPF